MGTVCRSFITATATLFLILTAAHLQEVKSFGIFELNLVSFENRDNKEFLGGCCSGRLDADGSCPPCPVYLRVCVKHYQAIVDPASPCTFHEFVTPVLESLNETGKDDLQVLNEQDIMRFDLNFTWPGEFSLIVEAWHPPERNTGSNKVLVARLIAQRTLKVGLDWTPDDISNNKSSLKVMYRVYCAIHYYGSNCGKLCRPRDDTFGHYTCKDDGQKLCKTGWTGNYCDKALCLPGCKGTCERPNECHCRPGWEGDLCDTCTRYPGCQHGTCVQPYQCNCDEGWGGLFCDQDLNYCTNNKPCHNGGTCTNTGQGSYTCSCTNEFMGENCDKLRNPCQRNPCRNNGICQNIDPGQYTCECAQGFYGPHCETTSSVCTENPCENGGSCVSDPRGAICNCPPGFSGYLCDKIDSVGCAATYCSNGGTCVELPSGPHCNCPQGLSGDHCEVIVTCSSNVCKNGGTCRQHPTTRQFSCDCPAGFFGWYCEAKAQNCAPNLCANGGECRDSPRGYYCDCKPGYGGKDCSIPSHECGSCLNGATCRVDPKTGGRHCLCPKGYRGDRCQHRDNASTAELSGRLPVASNVSHRISSSSSSEETEPLSRKQVALIASLSTILPILVILLCCIVCCSLRRRKQQKRAAEPPSPKAKDCDFDVEDEQLQNERNMMMHMNNKQCNVPQQIVNTLDRLPAKVSNEAMPPPKVLNIEVGGKKVLDKGLVCPQRTLQKKDADYGTSISHKTQEWSSSNNAGIYVIEDHFRSCPDVGPTLEVEKILATEV